MKLFLYLIAAWTGFVVGAVNLAILITEQVLYTATVIDRYDPTGFVHVSWDAYRPAVQRIVMAILSFSLWWYYANKSKSIASGLALSARSIKIQAAREACGVSATGGIGGKTLGRAN